MGAVHSEFLFASDRKTMTPTARGDTPPHPLTTAIVLHYQHWPGVADTIRSLRSQTMPVSILLVDNASADGSVEQIRLAFPDLKIAVADANRGYAAGMNLGCRYAAEGNLLLVTHDVVLASDAIEQMSRAVVGDVGLVGPLLYYLYDRDEIFSSGGFVAQSGVLDHHKDVPSCVRDADWVDGACMLVRGEALSDVGPIDEGYFLYFEEADFAANLRRAGWRVRCVPDAHAWQQPAAVPIALFTRNWLRFLTRNGDRSSMRSALIIIWCRLSQALRHRRFRRALLLSWGVIGFALGIPPRFLRQQDVGTRGPSRH